MGYLNLHTDFACILGTSGYGRRAEEAFHTRQTGINLLLIDISWCLRKCWCCCCWCSWCSRYRKACWCWKSWNARWCGDGSSVDGDRRDNDRKDDVLELHFEGVFEEKKTEGIKYM